jgi:tetratricopeptide (TPR) repeat protein
MRQVRCVVALLLGLGVLAGCASLTPAQYKERGLRELRAGQLDDARASFASASQGTPADGEALFLHAVALNRLGRGADAAAALARARAAGFSHDEMPREVGWSWIALKKWPEAVVELERYERTRPEEGLTASLLGRAYLGLGQLDRAEGWFKAAIWRDPLLEADALFGLAMIESRRKNDAGVTRYLEAIRDEHPGWTPLRAGG